MLPAYEDTRTTKPAAFLRTSLLFDGHVDRIRKWRIDRDCGDGDE